MRPGQAKFRIPVQDLLLDGIGAILLGIGLAKVFAGADVLPPAWRFENYAMTFVVGGIVMMLPMVFYMIGKAREQQNAEVRRKRNN